MFYEQFHLADGRTLWLPPDKGEVQHWNRKPAARNPHSDATFPYGPGEPHCYAGGPAEYTMRQNGNNWARSEFCR